MTNDIKNLKKPELIALALANGFTKEMLTGIKINELKEKLTSHVINIPTQPEISKTEQKVNEIPRYTYQPTDNPDLFRVCDSNGDWVVYFHDKLKRYFWSVNYVIGIGWPKDKELLNWLRDLPKEESEKIFTQAGTKGTKVHAAIRDLTDGIELNLEREYKNDKTKGYERLTVEEWDSIIAFTKFVQAHSPQTISRDLSVFQAIGDDGVAGTPDWRGFITLKTGQAIYINDRLTTIKDLKTIKVLLDYKTGSLRDEAKLQTAWYDRASAAPAEFTGVLKLGKKHKVNGKLYSDDYELRLWDYKQTQEHYARFRSAWSNFKFKFPKNYEHNDLPLPLSIAVEMPLVDENGQLINKEKK